MFEFIQIQVLLISANVSSLLICQINLTKIVKRNIAVMPV